VTETRDDGRRPAAFISRLRHAMILRARGCILTALQNIAKQGSR
jgi:hypothetical protein